jgi:hypothetical protein
MTQTAHQTTGLVAAAAATDLLSDDVLAAVIGGAGCGGPVTPRPRREFPARPEPVAPPGGNLP